MDLFRTFSFRNRATPPPPSEAPTSPDTKTDWLESWLTSLEIKFRGGMTEMQMIPEAARQFSQAIISSARATRRAARFRELQVRVKKDGSVEVQKLLEGEPALADAAIAAVKQWRAKPAG